MNFETLSRRKKEIMAEVERLGEEEGFHHFYWNVQDPGTACKECARRNGRLINKYDIKYTLDAEFCVAEGDEVCAFELAPLKPTTVYKERERLLEELGRLEKDGAPGVRWMTADVDNLDDRCIKRHGRVYTMPQAKQQLDGEFCVFADPALGCQCHFDVVAAEEVERLTAPPVAAPESATSEPKAGCGASFLVFALPAFGMWLIG
jgi:hypothetical protein